MHEESYLTFSAFTEKNLVLLLHPFAQIQKAAPILQADLDLNKVK